MSAPLSTIQAVYAAFGRGDILELLDHDVDWQFVANASAPYTARVRGRAQVAEWFSEIPKVDDIQAFEPREFYPGNDHVTVLGWERTADRTTGQAFESPWVHVFEVRGGRITRFFGIFDTEASAKARA